MDLSFLTPLYERPGPWASVYAATSTVDEATPEQRELALAGEEPVCLLAYVDRKGADFELEESRAGLVVLAGDERERRAVYDALPLRLQPLTVETDHGGRSAGADSRLLDEDVERARQEHARRRAAAELERFRAARDPSADGGIVIAAEGVPALVDAAREHRISELLVDPDGPDAGREVWVGDEPHQLAVRRTDARYLSDGEPHTARADDALLRSAAMTGAEAIRVPPADGTAPVAGPAGGLGALLRWAWPDGT
ncbi:hypothetical protein [Streptomyces flavidovirens]|uniref:baeRF2 domain-containing protein n=1 Tax=Streptomyces flavidovirens TaxID=67298 RepID=UPI0003F815B9|nr:hypothetical protein [Streptomyces flavidovirens]